MLRRLNSTVVAAWTEVGRARVLPRSWKFDLVRLAIVALCRVTGCLEFGHLDRVILGFELLLDCDLISLEYWNSLSKYRLLLYSVGVIASVSLINLAGVPLTRGAHVSYMDFDH